MRGQRGVSTKRIQVIVTAHIPKIRLVLNDVAAKSPLKQVADVTVSSLKPIRISRQVELHSRRPIRVGCTEQQVQMVGKHHEGIHQPAVALDRQLQPLDELLMIVIVLNNILSVIPARHHMVDRTGILNP